MLSTSAKIYFRDCLVADIDKDNEVSEFEACFAFRVWLCWKTLYPKISAMFERLDQDTKSFQMEAYEEYLDDLVLFHAMT